MCIEKPIICALADILEGCQEDVSVKQTVAQTPSKPLVDMSIAILDSALFS